MINKILTHPVATLIKSLILRQHNFRRKATKSLVLVNKSLGFLNKEALTKTLMIDSRRATSIDRSSKAQMTQDLTTLNKRCPRPNQRNFIEKDWRGLDLWNKILPQPEKVIKKTKALVSRN